MSTPQPGWRNANLGRVVGRVVVVEAGPIEQAPLEQQARGETIPDPSSRGLALGPGVEHDARHVGHPHQSEPCDVNAPARRQRKHRAGQKNDRVESAA